MRRKPVTPKSIIKSALRRMFLQSRERHACLKRGRCAHCGTSKPRHELEAHHVKPIDWQRVYNVIKDEVLTSNLVCLCVPCHEKTDGYTKFERKVKE